MRAKELTNIFSNSRWLSTRKSSSVSQYPNLDDTTRAMYANSSLSSRSLEDLQNDTQQFQDSTDGLLNSTNPLVPVPDSNTPVFVDTPFGVMASFDMADKDPTDEAKKIVDMMTFGVVAIALQNVPSATSSKADYDSFLSEITNHPGEGFKFAIHSAPELNAGFVSTAGEPTGLLIIANPRVFPSVQVKSRGLNCRSVAYELTTPYNLTVEFHNIHGCLLQQDETRRYAEFCIQKGHVVAGRLNLTTPRYLADDGETKTLKRGDNKHTDFIGYDPCVKLRNYHLDKEASNGKRLFPALFQTDDTKETAAKKLLELLSTAIQNKTFSRAELLALLEKHVLRPVGSGHSKLREAVLHALPYETVLALEAEMAKEPTKNEFILEKPGAGQLEPTSSNSSCRSSY